MNKIQMVDLKGQYEKIKKEVNEALQRVIDTTSFVKGKEVKIFEESLANYVGVNHCIACGNGTDALQIALMALGLKPGDEVITTDFTFIATVEVIALLGLKPVLVDVDSNTFLLDINKVKKAITKRTKAIIPVHLFGQNADMEALNNIADKYHLYIIEDAAQSLGSDYFFKDGSVKKSGSLGHIACTSFFPSKNLGCFGDGGAIFTDDSKLADEIRCIANHGMRKKYYHDRIGVNSRLDGIQAAILQVKLSYLNAYCQARQNAADVYKAGLNECQYVTLPEKVANSTHVFHQYTLKIHDGKRDALKDHLNQSGIPAMIYYPVPLHKQKAFQEFPASDTDFAVTNQLSNEVLSLPMHTELEEQQQQFIVKIILEFFN